VHDFFEPASYQFSWFSLPVVAVGLLNWLLGAATLRRERASLPSRTLMAMTFTIGVWLIGLGGANATHDPGVATVWIKVSMLGTVFVPVCAFMHAAAGSSRFQSLRRYVLAGMAVSVVLAILVLTTGWVFAYAHRYYWGYYPIYGRLGPLLIAYYCAFFAAGRAIYRTGETNTQSDTHRKRMRLRQLALALAMPAAFDFLPTLHIGLYPFGYAFIFAYTCVSTYSIWRYRLVDITPALAASQVIGTMVEGLLVVDRDGVVRVANGSASSMCRIGRPLIGATIDELDTKWAHGALAALLDPDVANEREIQFEAPDGEPAAALVGSSKLFDHLNAWVGTVFIMHDITERFRAERSMRESEERFRSLVQNASDLITVITPDTTILYQSPAIRRVLGYDPDLAVGRKLVDFLHPEDQPRLLNELTRLMSGRDETVAGEGRVRDAAGEWRDLEFTATDQRDHPSIGGLVLNVRDISERRRLEEQVRYQALHDPLTQLANRARFLDRLAHALDVSKRSGMPLAVLFIDIDDFKGINDTLGHAAGDALLTEVARRLEEVARETDTVARLGGDEFALLLEGVRYDDSEAAANRVLDAVQSTYIIDGKEILVRASIGVAVSEGQGAYTADQLVRDADIAMYAAKAQGKGCFRMFESTMEVSMIERLQLIADLPRALDHGQFVLDYQPIIVLRNGELFGLEALVRWDHPVRGRLAPAEFIPLAEESGAIVRIGAWVLQEACRQAAVWQRRYPGARWTVSVNVSVKQLQQAGFVGEVRDALAQSGLAHSRLILEITESVVMKDTAMMLQRLSELKALGVGLAIDDFGTGYSSLSYLREFPFDFLKIDRSFIDDVARQTGTRDLTRAIIELGKTLELDLIAEGIEQKEQLTRLRALDCDLGQGFFLAEPMAAAQAEEWLSRLGPSNAAAA
jgi:diguanylate cyclase (GGDEF)-like protein/PAS domain S-box-containing protein